MTGGEREQAGGPRWTSTWLGGVRSSGVDLGYPGEGLGLPENGAGSAAGYGRRLIALFVDWGIALLIASVLTRALDGGPQQRSLTTLAIFGAMVWLLTSTVGMTIGKRLCGIRVVRLDGAPIGFGWTLARTLLLLAVIPALLWDRNHRGMHDRAANTAVVTL